MAADIHVNDTGTAFLATVVDEDGVAINVSTATVKKIWFAKPNGSTSQFDADFVTNGADGKIQYVTDAGDLDQPGTWKVQGYVEFSSGRIHSNVNRFKVKSNLRSDPD